MSVPVSRPMAAAVLGMAVFQAVAAGAAQAARVTTVTRILEGCQFQLIDEGAAKSSNMCTYDVGDRKSSVAVSAQAAPGNLQLDISASLMAGPGSDGRGRSQGLAAAEFSDAIDLVSGPRTGTLRFQFHLAGDLDMAAVGAPAPGSVNEGSVTVTLSQHGKEFFSRSEGIRSSSRYGRLHYDLPYHSGHAEFTFSLQSKYVCPAVRRNASCRASSRFKAKLIGVQVFDATMAPVADVVLRSESGFKYPVRAEAPGIGGM